MVHFIKLGNCYYHGFDFCVKIEEDYVVVIKIEDNVEYTYFLEEYRISDILILFRGSIKELLPMSFYKMTQILYNKRLVRFVNQILATYKDFTITDESKEIIGKYATLDSFRGSLELDAKSFSHKIIDIYAIEPSSSVEDCDTKSKTLS